MMSQALAVQENPGQQHLAWGAKFLEDGDLERAYEQLWSAVSLCPGSALYRIWYAFALYQGGYLQEALEQYRFIAQLAPGSQEAAEATEMVQQIEVALTPSQGGRAAGGLVLMIVGFPAVCIGTLLCFTFVGAIVGAPVWLVGTAMFISGFCMMVSAACSPKRSC